MKHILEKLMDLISYPYLATLLCSHDELYQTVYHAETDTQWAHIWKNTAITSWNVSSAEAISPYKAKLRAIKSARLAVTWQ